MPAQGPAPERAAVTTRALDRRGGRARRSDLEHDSLPPQRRSGGGPPTPCTDPRGGCSRRRGVRARAGGAGPGAHRAPAGELRSRCREAARARGIVGAGGPLRQTGRTRARTIGAEHAFSAGGCHRRLRAWRYSTGTGPVRSPEPSDAARRPPRSHRPTRRASSGPGTLIRAHSADTCAPSSSRSSLTPRSSRRRVSLPKGDRLSAERQEGADHLLRTSWTPRWEDRNGGVLPGLSACASDSAIRLRISSRPSFDCSSIRPSSNSAG